MGSTGVSGGRVSGGTSLEGKGIDVLSKYTDWQEGNSNLVKDFGLDFASAKQLDAVRRILKGVVQYDNDYNKVPFNIQRINIERLSPMTNEEREENLRMFGRTMESKDIYVTIRTEPNSDNAYIRMSDSKYRSVIIGRNGGYYNFNNNGNRVRVTEFDAMYGNRDF